MTKSNDLELDDLELRYWSPTDLWGQHDDLLVNYWHIEIVWKRFDNSHDVHEVPVGPGRAVIVDLLLAGKEFGGVSGALGSMSANPFVSTSFMLGPGHSLAATTSDGAL